MAGRGTARKERGLRGQGVPAGWRGMIGRCAWRALIVLLLVSVTGGALAGCAGEAVTGANSTTSAPPATGASSTTSAPLATGAEELTGSALTALLTPEDVEKVSGLAEVRRAGRNPERRLGGDLNFVRPDGTPLLMVVIKGAEVYGDWKADADSFREELSGLGDEAFIGPSLAQSQVPYLVVVRSGERAVGLFTYDNPDVAGWDGSLSMDQLQALARVAISRL